VISANPFLTGKDCAYVVAWAEKKMSGKAPRYKDGGTTVGAVTTTIVKTSPEFIAYRETVVKLVGLAVAPAGTPPPGDDATADDAAGEAGLDEAVPDGQTPEDKQ
jgi:hypothetical protein